jgi:hypothetical protein
MSVKFPESLDTLSNPNSTDSLSNPSHSEQHRNANDAIEALQTKVGIDNSEDENSLDYKVLSILSQLGDISNNTDIIPTLLGLEGNNDLVVEGIENKTILDSFNKNVYRTVNYSIQISKGSEYSSSEIKVLQDGANINIVESNVISNTNNNLANITFEENSGIISLCVTPTSTAVTARYIRTAIKI